MRDEGRETRTRRVQAIVRLHALAHRAAALRVPLVPRALDLLIRLIFSAALPAEARVARSVVFEHSGLGVVINSQSVIEDRCRIGVHVVLGGRSPMLGAPHLEAGVVVHSGAKLIGPIRVGQGSVVAANAVVIEDVPPFSLVAGVPARIKKSGIDPRAYEP